MRQRIVNTIGAFGYLSLILQWTWSLVTLGAPLVTSQSFQSMFLPHQSNAPVDRLAINVPEPLGVVFSIVAVIFAVGITIYAIYAVPRGIGRSAHKATQTSAAMIIPHITHHRRISKKRQKRLVERITWTMKFTVALVPLALLVIPTTANLALNHSVVAAVGIYLGIWSLGWFGSQYLLTRIWNIDARDAW